MVTRAGSKIFLGAYNLVVDATAGTVFAESGGTITIKETTFVGDVQTTGTVTLLNGATISGVVTSSEGTWSNLTVSGFVADSDVVLMTTATPDGSGSNVLQTFESVTGTVVFSYIYTGISANVGVFKSGYRPLIIKNVALTATTSSIAVIQQVDPSYA